MALHKRHTHGRVFVGDEARELLAIHRRDSHGNDIKMNVPDNFDASATPSDVVTTVQPMTTQVSVIYVTLPQTFSGSAVYSTLTGSDGPQPTNGNIPIFGASAATGSSASPNFFTGAAATSVAQKTGGQTMATQGPTVIAGAPVQASSGAQSDSTTQDAGMSGGAKAGVAFGVLFAIALVFGLIFFCWRRKKNPSGHEEIVDEKHTSFVDAKAKSIETRTRTSDEGEKRASLRSTRSASTAPRLSLRPVTQFLPNLGGNEAANNRNTTDSFLAVGAAANAGSGAAKSAWERKPSGAANPFGDESAAAASAAAKSRSPSPQANPFDEKAEQQQAARSASAASKHTAKSSVGSADGSVSGAAAAALPAAAAAAGGAPRSAPGPAPGPNNVHRVQLDFKPSMEDELELRSGQLVRMLHEYDDGWALCIRMDRSQQGVAPRTCLSKLPVKPRPQGPPPQGGPRPGPGPQQQQQRPPMGPGGPGGPNMQNGPPGPRRPSNPQQNNGMQQPGVIPGAMYPRPLTPTQGGQPQGPPQQQQQQRPMQQQQQQQQRPQQQPQQQRPMQQQQQSQQPQQQQQAPRSAPSSPPRKPVVPGQAM
jgi:hypothetical protein